MGLVKRTYVDQETVITAENLNAIQDAIIENEEAIEDQGEAIEGKYAKPSGGIPSTDLDSAVQTSLGKADTAYQKPSGGIPSTDMASAVQTSLGKADSAYQKPSGGIPATDMASGVQTSLGKADTALQSSDIDNTLSVTGKAADAKKTGDEISGIKNTLTQLDAEKVDEASLALRRSGATNTGAQIESGTYFYLDGTLKHAIATIAQNASFTAQNCETVTAGGLNSLNDDLSTLSNKVSPTLLSDNRFHIYQVYQFQDLSRSDAREFLKEKIAYISTDASSKIPLGAYVGMFLIVIRYNSGFAEALLFGDGDNYCQGCMFTWNDGMEYFKYSNGSWTFKTLSI